MINNANNAVNNETRALNGLTVDLTRKLSQ